MNDREKREARQMVAEKKLPTIPVSIDVQIFVILKYLNTKEAITLSLLLR